MLDFRICNKSNASFYAGLLVAAFALAEACTGLYWGALSDRIGRKPVLLFGCFGTILSLLIVGFSQSFWIALLGRILGGALNGNVGVIQSSKCTLSYHRLRRLICLQWLESSSSIQDMSVSRSRFVHLCAAI